MRNKKIDVTAPTTKNVKRGIYTRAERLSLMFQTTCDERTIRRWERGETIKESTRSRLEKAARMLKLVIPDGRPIP